MRALLAIDFPFRLKTQPALFYDSGTGLNRQRIDVTPLLLAICFVGALYPPWSTQTAMAQFQVFRRVSPAIVTYISSGLK